MREFRRKFIHWSFGSAFILFLLFFGFDYTLMLIFSGLLFGGIISFLLYKNVKIPFFHRLVEDVEREHEKELPGKGALLFFAGSLAIMLLFYNKTFIVLGSWIVLTYGDGIASIVGKRFGKIKLPKNRSLEGTTIGIMTSFVFLQAIFPIQTALIAAFTGMLAEFLPIDDNLSIPLATAITLAFLL